jgi:hypothetical protein
MVWLAGILIFITFTLIVIVSIRDGKKWEERFPPISDDEFMARMPHGTNREIALKVRRIVADVTVIEYERIHPDSSFARDLDF